MISDNKSFSEYLREGQTEKIEVDVGGYLVPDILLHGGDTWIDNTETSRFPQQKILRWIGGLKFINRPQMGRHWGRIPGLLDILNEE